jgi:hypothetical protein
MGDLILNSFPVEITPHTLSLPYVEYDDWDASTYGRDHDFSRYTTYRYDRTRISEAVIQPGKRIRLLLLSGPSLSGGELFHDVDVGIFPALGSHLIEQSLSRYLASQGMKVDKTSFENFALARVEVSSNNLIHLYSGISYQARRPFALKPYSFVISAQWVARAVFSASLANPSLASISQGLGVLYTPRNRPAENLDDFQNHYLGHVKQVGKFNDVVVVCRDGEIRSIPLADLTLEASPEAIRRCELENGGGQQSMRVWRKIQQLSKVLTSEGRRNTLVLRDRLEAIRGVLGGHSREQLVMPLHSYATGAVCLGLAPIRAEIPA